MMGNIRYIFSDLDGTLLDSKKCVSPEALELIGFLREEHGIRFGVATGRSLTSLYPLLARTGLDKVLSAIVANNGVETICCETGARTDLPKVSREKIQEILWYYRDLPQVAVCFHNHDCFFTTKENQMTRDIAKLNLHARIANPMEDDSYQPTPRVMLIFDPADFAAVRAAADRHPFAGLHPLLSEAYVYEYLDQRVSKARGVEQYVAGYGHSLSHVMALGDSDNDVDLLRECGFGVAMKNGTPAVLDAARDMTAHTNDQNGVYRYLKNHLHLFTSAPND